MNHNKRLADNITTQFEGLRTSSINYRMICINRVPHHIRSVNPQAYTPMVISIGPYHHFDEKLQTMEKIKLAYLSHFIARVKIELEKFVSTIKELEEMIRRCYAETSSLSMNSDYFVTMILLDAIFILELFHKYCNRIWTGDDPLLTKNQWMFPLLMLDLVLLENQLPFFVLEELYSLAFDTNVPSLSQLTFEFFNDYNFQTMSPDNVEIQHFTELMRTFQLPLRPSRRESSTPIMMVKLPASATQLYDAGVKFEGNSSMCLLDLHYEKGVLKMPRLELDDQTEALVRNVTALEQLDHWSGVYLTDYFIFLDSLINTIEDINLLCDRGILVNRLGDDKAAFSLVKKLITNIKLPGMNSDFTIICEGLNEFYTNHRWKATLSVTTLKNQYFNNPWRGAGTIAACLLLLFTLTQTIMSILQVAMA